MTAHRDAPVVVGAPTAMADVVYDDGTHYYQSTHCRHGHCTACAATELAPGVPRRPAQCKGCGAPCMHGCHDED